MVITLSSVECEMAKMLGRARRQSNRAKGVKDRLVAKEEPEHRDIEGVGAEIAFAKAYGLYPPFDIGIRSGSCDFFVNGKSIDVKQSDYENARLIVSPDKADSERSCDIYVLATGKLPMYNFRGYARKKSICNPKNLIKLRSMVYALEIKDLIKMP